MVSSRFFIAKWKRGFRCSIWWSTRWGSQLSLSRLGRSLQIGQTEPNSQFLADFRWFLLIFAFLGNYSILEAQIFAENRRKPGEFQVTVCGVTVCPFSRHKGNQRPKCLSNKAQMHLSRNCPFSNKTNLHLELPGKLQIFAENRRKPPDFAETRLSHFSGVAPANKTKERAKTKSSWISPIFVWILVFFLRKTGTIHISNLCSGMPLWKVHELTFLWFGLPGQKILNLVCPFLIPPYVWVVCSAGHTAGLPLGKGHRGTSKKFSAF